MAFHFHPCKTRTFTRPKSISSTLASWNDKQKSGMRGSKKKKNHWKETRWHFKCTAKRKLNMYLRHISLLIDGNEDFVEKRFEIITLDSVHDKPLKRRHWKWEPRSGCVGELCTLNIFSAIIPNGFMIPIIPFCQRFSHLLLRTIYT